jgi:hypothetical protein
MLINVMEGEPIARNDFNGIRSFLISLLRPYHLAGRMSQASKFNIWETYIYLMHAKLPHLIPEWTEEFESEDVQRELMFHSFKSFVLKVTRMDEKILKNGGTLELTSQSKDQDPRDVSTLVRSRSDSGLEEAASGKDTHSTMYASLPVTGQRKTTCAYGCPICGGLHNLMYCLMFLYKAPIQRWRFCKRENLCLKRLGRNHLLKNCYHTSLLLHGVKSSNSRCSGLFGSEYLV